MKGSSPNAGTSPSHRKLVQLNLGQAGVSVPQGTVDWADGPRADGPRAEHRSGGTETIYKPWSSSELLQGLDQEEERWCVMARQKAFLNDC